MQYLRCSKKTELLYSRTKKSCIVASRPIHVMEIYLARNQSRLGPVQTSGQKPRRTGTVSGFLCTLEERVTLVDRLESRGLCIHGTSPQSKKTKTVEYVVYEKVQPSYQQDRKREYNDYRQVLIQLLSILQKAKTITVEVNLKTGNTTIRKKSGK